MPLTDKVLWVVDMSDRHDEQAIAQHAATIGANTVCIRTSSPILADAIPRFHAAGMKVYAWRWPAVVPTRRPPHYFATDQANFVATTLIPAGLDGYIVDPESDDDHGVNDWERRDVGDLAQLAQSFCATIRHAAANSGRPFLFGTTSGSNYPRVKPKIPFQEFFAASDRVYPQTYWRMRDKHDRPVDIHGGTPASAMPGGLADFAVAHKPIIPMAGEIDTVTPEEIAQYGALLAQHNITEGHFYEDNLRVPPAVLDAIRLL